uniref:Thiolase_N domain-containing protein n=1 Tax=Heterorhabditis bacteriophora TaxID=37862 RepID=A0A1I7X8V7_HETBA
MSSKAGVFIVGAKRTAFGTFGGKLKNHTATDLGVVATQAALEHSGLKPENIDHVIFVRGYIVGVSLRSICQISNGSNCRKTRCSVQGETHLICMFQSKKKCQIIF